MKVGLILYSVRDEMAKDPIKTVEEVGKLGYRYLEACNHNAIKDNGIGFGVSAEEILAKLNQFGSKVISAHIFPFEMADIHQVIRYQKILGNKNLVIPMGRFTTYDELMKLCQFINTVGKVIRDEGMNLLYHNHDQEYRSFNGKNILDILVENTDPDCLSLELDTFWTMRAGCDPVEKLKHFGKRIKLVHQKDFAWDSLTPINLIGLTAQDREMKPGDEFGIDGKSLYAQNPDQRPKATIQDELAVKNTAFTEIGTGIMPIQQIIDAANTYTDAEYIILEQDYTRLPTQFDSIKKSMDAFRKYEGISWT
jgi:sugar phosphate isomerase/epimerase